MKKRIGNDFQMLWVITENGETVDISTVTDFALSVHLSSSIYFTPDYVISDGSPLVQITKEQINELGTYYFLATWRVEDANYADGYRDVTADVTTFEIVPKSAQEEDVTETITSEVALGYQGKDAFQVWQAIEGNEDKTKDDFYAYLREPAVEAAAAANETNTLIQEAEGIRVSNEIARVENEEARIVFEEFDAEKEGGYVVGNKVSYEGSCYYCIADNSGVLPTDTDYWLLIAEAGRGITSIVRTSGTGAAGTTDTYTITYTDGTTTTFDVTNGVDGHSPEITFVGTTIYVDGVAGADLKGDTGASAYEIYVAETTDDPPMTINEWGNLMTGILNVLNSI